MMGFQQILFERLSMHNRSGPIDGKRRRNNYFSSLSALRVLRERFGPIRSPCSTNQIVMRHIVHRAEAFSPQDRTNTIGIQANKNPKKNMNTTKQCGTMEEGRPRTIVSFHYAPVPSEAAFSQKRTQLKTEKTETTHSALRSSSASAS